MTAARISNQQAHDFALYIVSDISAYINSHRAEYLAYLKNTMQSDPQFESYGEAAEHTEDKAYE